MMKNVCDENEIGCDVGLENVAAISFFFFVEVISFACMSMLKGFVMTNVFGAVLASLVSDKHLSLIFLRLRNAVWWLTEHVLVFWNTGCGSRSKTALVGCGKYVWMKWLRNCNL